MNVCVDETQLLLARSPNFLFWMHHFSFVGLCNTSLAPHVAGTVPILNNSSNLPPARFILSFIQSKIHQTNTYPLPHEVHRGRLLPLPFSSNQLHATLCHGDQYIFALYVILMILSPNSCFLLIVHEPYSFPVKIFLLEHTYAHQPCIMTGAAPV